MINIQHAKLETYFLYPEEHIQWTRSAPFYLQWCRDQSWERLQSVLLILKESRTKAASFSDTPKTWKKNEKHKKKHVVNFYFYFLNHNSRPDLTSSWHPQVKLSGRGQAGLSPAQQWVEPRNFFEVPGSQTRAIPLSHHPWDPKKNPNVCCT